VAGQDESLYFNDVIPLFYPGTPLFQKYNYALKTAFTSAFIEGGASVDECDVRWSGITNIFIEGIDTKIKLAEIENRLLTFYKAFLKPTQTEVNQNARANRCFNTIKDYIVGDVVLDYGCGKGLLGEKIHSDLKKETILVENIDFNKTLLPLLMSDKNGKTSLENNSACIIVLVTGLWFTTCLRFLNFNALKTVYLILASMIISQSIIRLQLHHPLLVPKQI